MFMNRAYVWKNCTVYQNLDKCEQHLFLQSTVNKHLPLSLKSCLCLSGRKVSAMEKKVCLKLYASSQELTQDILHVH